LFTALRPINPEEPDITEDQENARKIPRGKRSFVAYLKDEKRCGCPHICEEV